MKFSRMMNFSALVIVITSIFELAYAENSDEQTVVDENLRILAGEPVSALPHENHDLHLSRHADLLRAPYTKALIERSPDRETIIQSMQAHIMEHLLFRYPNPVTDNTAINPGPGATQPVTAIAGATSLADKPGAPENSSSIGFEELPSTENASPDTPENSQIDWRELAAANAIVQETEQLSTREADTERKTCKMIKPTGTRIARRYCLTAEQWGRLQDKAGDTTEDLQVGRGF